jgi:hypothetical protein
VGPGGNTDAAALGYDAAFVDISYTGLGYRYFIDQPLETFAGIISDIVPGNRDQHGIFPGSIGRDKETGAHAKFFFPKGFQIFLEMFRFFPEIRRGDFAGGKSLQMFYNIRNKIKPVAADDGSVNGTPQKKTGSRDGSVPGLVYR